MHGDLRIEWIPSQFPCIPYEAFAHKTWLKRGRTDKGRYCWNRNLNLLGKGNENVPTTTQVASKRERSSPFIHTFILLIKSQFSISSIQFMGKAKGHASLTTEKHREACLTWPCNKVQNLGYETDPQQTTATWDMDRPWTWLSC